MRIAGTQPLRQRRPRLVDDAYRKHVASQPCMVCGLTNATVAAHIRAGKAIKVGYKGGMGMKPDDSLCIPLCNISGCAAHDAFDTDQEKKAKELLHMNIDALKRLARGKYQEWKQQQEPPDGMDD